MKNQHHALLPVHSSRNMAQHLRNMVKGKAGLAVLSWKMSSRLQQKCWVNLRNVSHEGLLFIISLPARTSLTFCCQRWSFSSVSSRHYKESCSDDTLTNRQQMTHPLRKHHKDMYKIHVIVHTVTIFMHWKLKLLLEHFSFARERQEEELTDFSAKKFNLKNELCNEVFLH